MTNAERQAAFKERQRKKGLVQLSVWVPADSADQIRELAAKLCEQAATRCSEQQ